MDSHDFPGTSHQRWVICTHHSLLPYTSGKRLQSRWKYSLPREKIQLGCHTCNSYRPYFDDTAGLWVLLPSSLFFLPSQNIHSMTKRIGTGSHYSWFFVIEWSFVRWCPLGRWGRVSHAPTLTNRCEKGGWKCCDIYYYYY